MTHTLNRTGLTTERRGEEIVILCMIHYRLKGQKGDEMQEMARILMKYKPDNFIGSPLGLEQEQLISMAANVGVLTAVYTDRDDIIEMIEEIKSRKLGISVVLSGLFADVRDICKAADLKEHTYHTSIGVFGKTEKLPDEKTLAILTQCGHGLVSQYYVDDIVKSIKKGKLTPEEGADLLAKPCVCGIVNRKRTGEILSELVKMEEGQ
jgi:hypothetical protein